MQIFTVYQVWLKLLLRLSLSTVPTHKVSLFLVETIRRLSLSYFACHYFYSIPRLVEAVCLTAVTELLCQSEFLVSLRLVEPIRHFTIWFCDCGRFPVSLGGWIIYCYRVYLLCRILQSPKFGWSCAYSSFRATNFCLPSVVDTSLCYSWFTVILLFWTFRYSCIILSP